MENLRSSCMNKHRFGFWGSPAWNFEKFKRILNTDFEYITTHKHVLILRVNPSVSVYVCVYVCHVCLCVCVCVCVTFLQLKDHETFRKPLILDKYKVVFAHSPLQLLIQSLPTTLTFYNRLAEAGCLHMWGKWNRKTRTHQQNGWKKSVYCCGQQQTSWDSIQLWVQKL